MVGEGNVQFREGSEVQALTKHPSVGPFETFSHSRDN